MQSERSNGGDAPPLRPTVLSDIASRAPARGRSAAPRHLLALAGNVSMRSGYLHLFELLRSIRRRAWSAMLVCRRISAEMRRSDLPFPVLTWAEIGGGWPFVGSSSAVASFAERQEAEVIHVHGAELGAAGRRFLGMVETPVVFTPHASDAHLWSARRIAARAARVIALTESLREGYLNRVGVPKEKLRLVRPGVDVSDYPIALPAWDGRAPVVGSVAPFEKGRGQECFLDAIQLMTEAGRTVEFVIAGDGRREDSLRRKADRLGLRKRVTFVTNLLNYRSVIASLDVFVRPTVGGGIGHTVIEAMALGKPVVVTAAEGMPEIVRDGVTGYIAHKDDARAIAECVGRILDDRDLALRMGRAARDRIEREFNTDTLTDAMIRIYDEVTA